MPGASASLVFAATGPGGEDLVLKVPLPGDDEVESWRGVLAFSGRGGTPLERYDPETGALLMRRLRPGTMLLESELTDLEAVDVCADIILSLRGSAPVATTPLAKWFRELDKAPDTPRVIDARRISRRLLESADRSVNLHGDLHQLNIIRDGDEWKAIDPKFLLGDPAHEVSGFMRNDIDRAKDAAGMRARLERFAERLGDPIERLWGWSFAQTVLCHAWSSQRTAVWERSIEAIWDARGS